MWGEEVGRGCGEVGVWTGRGGDEGVRGGEVGGQNNVPMLAGRCMTTSLIGIRHLVRGRREEERKRKEGREGGREGGKIRKRGNGGKMDGLHPRC